MPGAQSRHPARAAWATGLDALAAAINDALVAMGTQPAFAGGPLGASTARQAAIETSPVRHNRLARRPRPLRPADPLGPDEPGVPGGSADRDDPDDPQDTDTTDDTADTDELEVESDHVEVWQLVRRAQDGDGEAFGVLYDRYVDMVFRFIYYRVNDRALAEDFTSETFLRALRRIGSINYQGRDIGAWFVTIARNIVFDHMKSARHRLETTTADTIETKDHERSTEAAVLETLQSERLMEAVNALGAEQRECIMLRFIQGLSVSETAAAMGKNDGAIKALQHRAVRKLADLVGTELR